METKQSNLIELAKSECQKLVQEASNKHDGDLYSAVAYIAFQAGLHNERKKAVELAKQAYEKLSQSKDKIYQRFYTERGRSLKALLGNKKEDIYEQRIITDELNAPEKSFLEDVRDKIEHKLLKRLDQQESYLEIISSCDDPEDTIDDLKQRKSEFKEDPMGNYPVLQEKIDKLYSEIVGKVHSFSQTSEQIREREGLLRKLKRVSGIIPSQKFAFQTFLHYLEQGELEYIQCAKLFLSIFPSNKKKKILSKLSQQKINEVYAEAMKNLCCGYSSDHDERRINQGMNCLRMIKKITGKNPVDGKIIQRSYSGFLEAMKHGGEFMNQDGPWTYYRAEASDVYNNLLKKVIEFTRIKLSLKLSQQARKILNEK